MCSSDLNWVGGVFRGVVLANGEPVPGAEIEVEYLNHEPDFANHRFSDEAHVVAPLPGYEYTSVRADDNGIFVIGLPKAGWWGIGALGVGPDTSYQGKELSQDAVLWVQAKDM